MQFMLLLQLSAGIKTTLQRPCNAVNLQAWLERSVTA